MEFEFDEEKNIILKKIRGVNFEDIIEIIKTQGAYDDIKNPSKKFSHQRIFIIRIKNYIYSVPYIKNNKNIIFLKTIYPSRKLTKIYLKK